MTRSCSGAMSSLCQCGPAREYRIGATIVLLCDTCRDVAEAHGLDPRLIGDLLPEPEWVRLARERQLVPKVYL